MNNQAASEPRFIAAATKPVPQGIDRFEDEGGAGPADTSQQRPDKAPVVTMEIVQSELPLPITSPKCGGEDIRTQETPGAADPSQVIVTAGATAHSVQVHHRSIPDSGRMANRPILPRRTLDGTWLARLRSRRTICTASRSCRPSTMSRPPPIEALDRPVPSSTRASERFS